MKHEMKQGSEDFECFGDVFTLYRELGEPEDNKEYWDDVLRRIDEFTTKHRTPLGRELALAVMSVLNGETDEQRYARLITLVSLKAMENESVAQTMIENTIRIAKKWMEAK